MRNVRLVAHWGGCHRGRVKFEAIAPDCPTLLECNCSICSMSGFLHLVVPLADFSLLSGKDVLSSYRFHTKTAEHLFCSICGIKSFYVPRADPFSRSVNAHCLRSGTIRGATIKPFTGSQWDSLARRL